MCGRSRDAHNRHVRFTLPDPVLAAPQRERTAGSWLSHDDAAASVMMQVPGVGAFVRVLLPVSLLGGDTVTYGLWLGVDPEELQRAFSEWWAPTYPELVLEGRIANAVQPWGLLGRPATAAVRNQDETPYLTSSSDSLTAQVLTQQWLHDEVLGALPETVR
jgi:hypothetical protein